jgi:hypothetical protein
LFLRPKELHLGNVINADSFPNSKNLLAIIKNVLFDLEEEPLAEEPVNFRPELC